MNPNLEIVDEYHQHKPKPKKCYNCKHAGNSFKIAGKTHMHCCDENPDQEIIYKRIIKKRS